MYTTLSKFFPDQAKITTPQRIVLIRPCCIGDVVIATGALSALRELYLEAYITWAVSSWSHGAIAHHPAINEIIDTGSSDLPVRSVSGFLQFVRQLRSGNFDMAVSLVRSPLMSLAVWMAGIPIRVGIDSAGRGFGYNVRVPIDPDVAQHEGDIYLKVIQAIAGKPVHAYANLPVLESAKKSVEAKLKSANIPSPYIVVHPGGGSNPGMQMDSKRYPLDQLAAIINQVCEATSAKLILIGGPNDGALVEGVQAHLNVDAVAWAGELNFQEIGALSASALAYIGNDTGLTHIAAASGARTVMMMGPSDPVRYAPFTADHLVLWKPTQIQAGGVAAAQNQSWDWSRDGFTVEYAVGEILKFLATQ